MHTSDEIDALLPLADAVFCCLPSTPATVRMLDARRLGLMRDDAVLINVGRGDLIDTDALGIHFAGPCAIVQHAVHVQE